MRVCRRYTQVTMTDMKSTSGAQQPEQGGRRAPYDYQWRAFADWCSQEHGRHPMPAPPGLVARYLSERVAAGASYSTLRVMAAAIARRHIDNGLPSPCGKAIVNSVLADSERSAPPVTPRSRPLDLEAYRAIRRTAQERRRGRGGGQESRRDAQTRGLMDLAMIGLMRDGLLRVKDAAVLRWDAIERQEDGTGRLMLRESEAAVTRALSVDTIRLLESVRGDAGDDARIIGLMPNQISARIGAAATQAGLGQGYSGESPRLGMLKDLEELGAVLLGEQLDDQVIETFWAHPLWCTAMTTPRTNGPSEPVFPSE